MRGQFGFQRAGSLFCHQLASDIAYEKCQTFVGGEWNWCVWNECVEMGDSTCLPVLSGLRADTYIQREILSAECPIRCYPLRRLLATV
jgi:hypothetical protein